jgi:hypothetical protein
MFNWKPRWGDSPEFAFYTTATLNNIEDKPVDILNNNPVDIPFEQDPHGTGILDSDDSTLLYISESHPSQQSNFPMKQLFLHFGIGTRPLLPARPTPSLPARIDIAESEYTRTLSS